MVLLLYIGLSLCALASLCSISSIKKYFKIHLTRDDIIEYIHRGINIQEEYEKNPHRKGPLLDCLYSDIEGYLFNIIKKTIDKAIAKILCILFNIIGIGLILLSIGVTT